VKTIDKIKNNLINNELIRKGSGALLFRILGSLLGYFFLFLVTRNFGANSWGIFALSLAVLQISCMIGKFGLDIALIKFVAQFDSISKIKGIVYQSFLLATIFSLFISLLVYYSSDYIALYFFNKAHLSKFIKLISYAILPLVIITTIAQVFRGMKEIRYFAFIEYVSKFLFSVFIFIFLLKFLNFKESDLAFYSFIISLIFVAIFSIIFLFKRLRGSAPTYVLSKKQIINTAFPMMFSTSIFLLMSWSDTLMLGIYTTDYNVGIYNVALKISMITAIILGAVNSILAPKISETFNKNKLDDFKKLVVSSTNLISISTMPVVLILFLFPEFFLSFFGGDFVEGKSVLYLLLIGQCVNAFSGSVGFILQMTGNENLFQKILLYTLIINIFLNYLLIPAYQIKGAAIASLVSMIIWNLVSVYFVYKKYNVLTFFSFGYYKK